MPGDVAFGFGWVRVDDAKFRLIGVQGLRGSAYTIELELDWLEPLGPCYALEANQMRNC